MAPRCPSVPIPIKSVTAGKFGQERQGGWIGIPAGWRARVTRVAVLLVSPSTFTKTLPWMVGGPLASLFVVNTNYRVSPSTLTHSLKQTARQPSAVTHINTALTSCFTVVPLQTPSRLHLPDHSARGWLCSFTPPSPADIKHLLLAVQALLTD